MTRTAVAADTRTEYQSAYHSHEPLYKPLMNNTDTDAYRLRRPVAELYVLRVTRYYNTRVLRNGRIRAAYGWSQYNARNRVIDLFYTAENLRAR